MRTKSALIEAGFKVAGNWAPDPTDGVVLNALLPASPGVYAIAVGGEVRYVGAAQRGLQKRFQKYKNRHNKGSVAVRIRMLIEESLQNQNDDVSVLVFVPTENTESLTQNFTWRTRALAR